MKKYILILLLIILVSPSIASAAWWNPLTWFEKENVPAIQYDINTEVGVEAKDQSVSASNTTTSQTPVVQERVVEKTITVDNPELQKKINDLLQQNADLNAKVNSLTTSLNACKLTNAENPKPIPSFYSDFDFQYTYATNLITLLHSSSREISIRKAVFSIQGNYSDAIMKDLGKTGAAYSIKVGVNSYTLERTDDTTFSYIGKGIPITGSETITINVIGSSGVKFNMLPEWSEWDVWDYTAGKPVQIK